jgi:hypothetical protein
MEGTSAASRDLDDAGVVEGSADLVVDASRVGEASRDLDDAGVVEGSADLVVDASRVGEASSDLDAVADGPREADTAGEEEGVLDAILVRVMIKS